MRRKKTVVLMLGLAIVMAIVVVLAIREVFEQKTPQTSQQAKPANSQQQSPNRVPASPEGYEPLQVLVADTRLKVGGKIESSDVTFRAWPRDAQFSDTIVFYDPSEVDGKAKRQDLLDKVNGKSVRRSVPKGQPITENIWFDRGDSGFLPGVIAKDMRAVTIEVNQRTAASGFVLPGDRIDVFVSREIDGTDENRRYQARTVVEPVINGVKVVAVNKKTETDGKVIEEEPKTLTLEVTPAQAQAIHAASNVGEFGVALRPVGAQHTGSVPEDDAPKARAFTTDQHIFDDYAESVVKGRSSEAARPDKPAPGTRPETSDEGAADSVVIYRNGTRAEE